MDDPGAFTEQPNSDDGTRRRCSRTVWIAAGGVVLVALIAAVGAAFVPSYSDGHGVDKADKEHTTDTAAACDESTEPTGITKPEDAPGSQGIEVLEKGFATSDTEGKSHATLSFGAVAENSSDLVAKDVTLTFTALRPDGTQVTDSRKKSPWEYSETNQFIMPGQKFGTGYGGLIETDDLKLSLKLKVSIDVAEWWQVDNDVHKFGKLKGKLPNPENQEDWKDGFNFTVESDFCDEVRAGVGLVLRDSEGEIIGGATISPPRKNNADGKIASKYAAGKNSDLFATNIWYNRYKGNPIHRNFDVEPEPSKTSIFPTVAKA